MRGGYTFYERASRAFQDHYKILVMGTVSGGSILAISDGRGKPIQRVYADSGQEMKKMKKVVVLGTGWVGVSFLKNLKSDSYEVQVVSPRNYFTFTPLLPSVTCGTVEARSVVEPVRKIIRKVKDF